MGKEAGNQVPSTYGETHRPYSRSRRARNTNSILARGNWAERHWLYSGHYPRMFVAPKNARNAETKRQSGAVPILLLVIPASTTSTYSSLNVLQGLNPRPWLLKALVYHSTTSAQAAGLGGGLQEGTGNRRRLGVGAKSSLEVHVLACLDGQASGYERAGRPVECTDAKIRRCPKGWQWCPPGRYLWEALPL